ncbi:MAG: CRISPR-associated protein Cas4 [Acidobacteria bacterium]|jgi:CRISPR-associated exonuclease Cas4|nr:MAG: CRISPR-associated protein Cas4 [Acidobacteriota bacterium]GIU82900.1 MAG: CRISPR-associated protein Cas4 [Pyrinomonadaceae bacterium]
MTDEEFVELKTNGVKVNYYVVCPRKLWLYSHDIRLEKSSERVELGKMLHERSYSEQPRRELMIDNLIRIDLLEGQDKVLEIKYSQRMKEASQLQILYYLYYLKRLGITGLTGELRFPKERRRETVELTEEAEGKVEEALRQIKKIEKLPKPPNVEFMPICKRCAYCELCWG